MKRREDLRQWHDFILAESHVLQQYPELLFRQAANQPDSIAWAQKAFERHEKGLETRPWVLRVNKSQNRSACLLTFVGHTS
jgi:hypothetical protein